MNIHVWSQGRADSAITRHGLWIKWQNNSRSHLTWLHYRPAELFAAPKAAAHLMVTWLCSTHQHQKLQKPFLDTSRASADPYQALLVLPSPMFSASQAQGRSTAVVPHSQAESLGSAQLTAWQQQSLASCRRLPHCKTRRITVPAVLEVPGGKLKHAIILSGKQYLAEKGCSTLQQSPRQQSSHAACADSSRCKVSSLITVCD